ncbi:MAG TPA: hypothetical protein PK264_01595 [Hyphomicrobiaceae bacterium]|nr:hypothetical protein [Hyphomicrobiaceae bacterium]
MLGEKEVGFGVDRDVIEVGRSEGRFKALKLIVRKSDVFLIDLKVTYGNGQQEDLAVNQLIRAGTETPMLDLKGEARAIQRIDMVYRSRPGYAGRAVVEVWGLQHVRVKDRVPPGYAELDVQTFDVRKDEIRMPVGWKEGAYKAIRLRALDEPLFIRRVQIRYENGYTEDMRVRQAIAPGEMTSEIDLAGERATHIREVIVSLRPQPSARGNATLQLLGDSNRRFAIPPGYGAPPPPPPRPSYGPALSAVPRGWVLFGTQTVGFKAERDTIAVGREVGRFDKIAFRVSGNDILMRDIEIVFGNGETQRFPINAEIRANSMTPALDIGGTRFIREINMTYQAKPNFKGRATVEVFGEYAASWVSGDAKKHNDGWVLLGSQRAAMLKNDVDTFQVGRQWGTFRAIRVTAKGHAVRVNWLRVTYANGETEELPVNRELRGGETSSPIDLRGRERVIESIAINYRSRLNLGGEAVVEIWGLH